MGFRFTCHIIILIDSLGDSFERAAKGPSQMRKPPKQQGKER
jgi:hypothetical protein